MKDDNIVLNEINAFFPFINKLYEGSVSKEVFRKIITDELIDK